MNDAGGVMAADPCELEKRLVQLAMYVGHPPLYRKLKALEFGEPFYAIPGEPVEFVRLIATFETGEFRVLLPLRNPELKAIQDLSKSLTTNKSGGK